MRTNKNWVVCAALAALLNGCAFTKEYVQVSYTPQGNPMKVSGAEGVKVRVEVQDNRLVKDKVGSKKNGLGMETAPIIATNSVPEVFAQAIKTELQNRGFSISDGGIQVIAELIRFYNDFKITLGTWTGSLSVVTEAVMNVTVKSAGGRSLLARSIMVEGHNPNPHGLHSGPMAKIALDDGLQNVVAKLVNDSEFISALIKGENDGESAAAVVAAKRTIVSDVDALPQAAPGEVRGAAVVIGIEKYRQKLPEAVFAADDARLFSRYLSRVIGYQPDRIAVLTDDEATKADFEKYFERWLPNHVGPGDSVAIYYSGHGAPDPRTGDAYLVPYDGDPAYLDQTAYPLKKLYDQLAKLPVKNATVVLDSCFSGAGGRSVIARGARPLVNVTASAAVPGKVTVLSAAAGDQISQSYETKGHGLFTYFLLKGIQRGAIASQSSLRPAFDWASKQVSQVAREEYNTDQTPQWQEGR